jgi:pyruvate dehydrogenase E2 component (dihydrolipoyllysine-residue acetyltransferase)
VREPAPAQRTVARRTAEARATIPDIELSLDLEVDAAEARVRREQVSWDAALLRACAQALRKVPEANGAYRDGHFETYSRINVGFVVTREDSFLIPTVFDADQCSAGELGAELVRVAQEAQARTLLAPAFSGATFTFWNAGALGVARSGIIINPPQAGALACGAVRDLPVVRDGALAAGRVMTVTLACDHRILYGARAARLLAAFAQALLTESGEEACRIANP